MDRDFAGVESDCERDGLDVDVISSDDEFARPMKKKKMTSSLGESGESKFSNFTDEDLSYFVTRVSVENQDQMRNFLRQENGQMSGIIYKMIENRCMSLNAKVNKLHHKIEKKFEEMDKQFDQFNATLERLNGMSKFTYAWCKSAQEAGIYKMKQRY